MVILPWILLGCAAVALLLYGLGVLATVHHTGRKPPLLPEAELPPVSLLKPIKGAEESLEENLRSFYEQDYPSFEVVFATTDPGDAALPVARRVAADYPHVPTRFVFSDPDFGLNPKVANLAGALLGALRLVTRALLRPQPRCWVPAAIASGTGAWRGRKSRPHRRRGIQHHTCRVGERVRGEHSDQQQAGHERR